jgi:3'(2'), 5'-bisphosphate nucleotidase
MLSHLNIQVLSEEGEHFNYEKRKPLDRLWIVDPLDGTKEFVKRNGEFTVNIALVEKNRPIIGVIYSPVFKDLYFAAEGLGSFKIDRHTFIPALDDLSHKSLDDLFKLAKRLPLVSKRENYTIVASRSHLSTEVYQRIEKLKHEHKTVNIVNTGSSIKMCWVAEGIADEYPRFGPTMEWDTAAGQAILENAGCELIDLETHKPMLYNREQLLNNSFIAKAKVEIK